MEFSLAKEHSVRKEFRVLSLGAGVNSTALLVLKSQGRVDFDLAIFADTGGENPETYAYIENVIKPFCQYHSINLVIVKKEGDDLYTAHWKAGVIPLRMYRSCTDKYKKRVIRKYLLEHYPNENIIQLIGFCKGEEERAKNNECGAISPLIDLGINREKCVEIIKEAGLPIPIKSGCYFCPHQRMQSWIRLYLNHPDLYEKANQLEKRSQKYPLIFLSYEYPLEVLRRTIEANKGLKEGQQKQCSLYSSMPKTKGCPMCELEDSEEKKQDKSHGE